MKTTGFKAAVVVLLAASLILASEALAGGGGGYRRGGGGPGPGFGRGTQVNPQGQTPEPGLGPGGGAPAPQLRREGPGGGEGPWANVPPARRGNYAFCPYCGAPCPRGGLGAGLGIGRGPMSRFENRDGQPGPNFQGGAWGPWGQGFRRRAAIRQSMPMIENWRRGPWQGRGGEGFTPQDQTLQNRGQWRGWRQGGDGGRSGPDTLTPTLEENEDDFWAPPRWQRRGLGRGPDEYPPDEFDVPAGPEVKAPEPLQTPEANAPGLQP
jgi:hypothetical protein